MKTRLAPTPSGYLHLGNALSFRHTHSIAQQFGASLFLRIDDLDAARMRREYVQDIFDCLSWMNISWAEGPQNLNDFEAQWSQQHRLAHYQDTLARLIRIPDLVFACTCSRKELMEHNVYPGTCTEKQLPLDTPDAAWRIKVRENEVIHFKNEKGQMQTYPLGKAMGSFIIRRKEGLPAYHIASLSDDVHFGVDLIVRGNDLLPSTAAQMYLAQHLGLTSFMDATFIHHRLLLDAQGNKLSKSQGASPLKELMQTGIKADEYFANFQPWEI